MASKRDISFATFNLYNLQLTGKSGRFGAKYTKKEYDAKIKWSAKMLNELDADVIAFQELWSKKCLEDVFAKAKLNDYELVFIKDSWRDIAVAAAIRKPWKLKKKSIIKDFPKTCVLKKRGDGEESDALDDEMTVQIDKFTRTIIDMTIERENDGKVPEFRVFATHLKSKIATGLDKEEDGNPEIKKHATAIGDAISTIRRTAEAAALRIILTNLMKNSNIPVVILGDLNDSQLSNTLAILTEQAPHRMFEASVTGKKSDTGLYSVSTMQEFRSLRDVYYTHIYKDIRETLDHVLVSEQFYDHSKNRVWTFEEIKIWNDHLDDERAETSDHGLVRAAFRYRPAK